MNENFTLQLFSLSHQHHCSTDIHSSRFGTSESNCNRLFMSYFFYVSYFLSVNHTKNGSHLYKPKNTDLHRSDTQTK